MLLEWLLLSLLRMVLERGLRTQLLQRLLGCDCFLHELVALLEDGSDTSRRTGDLLHRDGWARKSGLDGTAVILVEELLLIQGGRMDYLDLGSDGGRVIFVHRCDLGRTWPHHAPTGAAVVADGVLRGGVIRNVVDDNGAVIDVRDVGVVAVDIGYSTVVLEVIAPPVAAIEAGADVAETIVNTAVVANVRAPVADVEAVASEGEAPVGRRP